MIPPTSGREHDPTVSPPEEAEASDAYRSEEGPPAEAFVARPSRYAPRVRILFFGILVGMAIAIVYAFAQTVLLVWASHDASPFGRDLFREPVRPFWATFVNLLSASAPWFILVATLAAAADAVLRRGERDARATRGVLKTLGQRTRRVLPQPPRSPARTAQEIVEPLQRELNLEWDDRRRDWEERQDDSPSRP